MAEARAEAGLVVARPIRMEAKQASAQIAGARRRHLRRAARSATSSRAPTDANDRVLGTELAGAIARSRIFDDGARAQRRRRARQPRVQRRLGRRPGPRRLQRLRRLDPGRGRRPGRRRQDDARRHRSSILKGKGAKGKRLNGSVGKSFAYGAQRGRLFVQGSADSRFCIRLSGADVVLAGEPERGHRRQPRLHRRPRQRQGLRLRVHDLGPRRRPRRPRPLGLRRDDRRPRLRPPQRLRHRPRGDRTPARRGRQGRAARSSTPRACSTSTTCSAHYAEELRATDQDEEAERDPRAWPPTRTENFLMVVPHKVQADPSISTE